MADGTAAPVASAPAPAPSPSASTVPASSPSPAPSGGSGNGVGDDPAVDAARSFTFDPFGDNDWRQRFDEFDNPQTSEPAQGATPDPGGAPAQPGVDPAAQTQAQPDAATALLARIAQAVERPVPPSGATPPGGQPGQQQQNDPYAGVPEYNLRVPEQWLQAIYSEDPAQRAQGLQLTLSTTARLAHARAVDQVRNEFARVLPTVVRHYLNELTETRSVSDGFYSQYPQLNNDATRPLVVAAAEQVMRETGQATWTPELRDAIAGRVFSILQQAGFVQQGGGAPAPAALPAPARAPVLSPGGARPGGAGGSNDIMKMLGM